MKKAENYEKGQLIHTMMHLNIYEAPISKPKST